MPLGPSQKKQPFPPRILQVVAGSFAVELSHSKAFKAVPLLPHEKELEIRSAGDPHGFAETIKRHKLLSF